MLLVTPSRYPTSVADTAEGQSESCDKDEAPPEKDHPSHVSSALWLVHPRLVAEKVVPGRFSQIDPIVTFFVASLAALSLALAATPDRV